jgi:hypothetical protein
VPVLELSETIPEEEVAQLLFAAGVPDPVIIIVEPNATELELVMIGNSFTVATTACLAVVPHAFVALAWYVVVAEM